MLEVAKIAYSKQKEVTREQRVQGCGSGSGMDPHYFWKLDPDLHGSEKLEVA
jgi:hypothetical protein